MRNIRLLYILPVLSLTGCVSFPSFTNWFHSKPSPPPTPPVVAPAVIPITKPVEDTDAIVTKAVVAVEAKHAAIDSKAAASAYAIGDANDKAPDSTSKPAITNEVNVIKATLPQPSAEDKAAALERANLMEQGKTAQANKLYADAITDAKTGQQEIGQLKNQLKTAEENHTKALADEHQKLVDANAANAKEINKMQKQIDDDRSGFTHSLQKITAIALVGAGIMTLVFIAFCLYTSGFTTILKAIPGVVGGLLLIGAGFVVSQPWFLWAAGIALGCAAVSGILMLIHLRKTHQLEALQRLAINDLKDEAESGVADAKAAAATLQTHLEYRLGTTANKLKTEIEDRLKKAGVNA